MGKKLDIVDFLRGFSIFTIVLMHLIQSYDLPVTLNKAAAFGGAGVHVFILCSGFGLYLSFLHKPLTYHNFIKRRFGKIYFPYIAIILVSAVWKFHTLGIFDWQAVLSHIFLYKMFFPEYESSFGGQMWFISTIIQFYIAWPLMVKLAKMKRGILISLLISLGWATFVAILGNDDERVWNSFFLQYIWEFQLGMWLAQKYFKNPKQNVIPQWRHIVGGIIIGMTLTGIMAWSSGVLKLYNDIPSLMGYLSVLLFIYKLNISAVNSFFSYTNRISYEWYLVHILAFGVVKYYLNGMLPCIIEGASCLAISYMCAYLYDALLKQCKMK